MPNSSGDPIRGTQRREELVRRHLSAESGLLVGERGKERSRRRRETEGTVLGRAFM